MADSNPRINHFDDRYDQSDDTTMPAQLQKPVGNMDDSASNTLSDEEWMRIAEKGMKQYSNTLRALAKQ